eukprot:m.108077 g.108077  ORF g.108077 m.108077 type:complete len:382 (+) comp27843_c1_seq1:164-1309(+)
MENNDDNMDDGDDYENDDYQEGDNVDTWLPPAADCAGDSVVFENTLEEHFYVPDRLAQKPISLVEAVNDFHFAMINDIDRNIFYQTALQKMVKPNSCVLEIGTGSGLLAMMAARAGAKHVYAVEANRDLSVLARSLMQSNGLGSKITVINALSSHVVVPRDLPEKADVMVSEILGTLLLGESALSFVADARKRLLKPGAQIIPAAGTQFISLIESNDIKSITSVSSWNGINLEGFDALQDTCNVVFTKQYGFRLGTTKYKTIVPRIAVASVDFYVDGPGSLPAESKTYVEAQESGVIHAAMCYWEAYADREKTSIMSTDPEATKDNFPRDMQWGQALQLIEDTSKQGPTPQPLTVVKGDKLVVITRLSKDSAVMQFEVNKL